MDKQERFQTVFTDLKSILEPFAPSLAHIEGRPDQYGLQVPYVERYGKELFFGSVEIRKNYVSFHLMPVYIFPTLLDGMSDALKKRMQGKSCFNFTKPDPALFEELAQLAAKGYETYQREYEL